MSKTLLKRGFILVALLALKICSFGQGRVVINEFMPWSGCSTTSEFIELMNFGPGPMNIGCYIVTNGQYAVTIPANTIIQPGQYYVIAGENSLPQNCGNIDSTIQVDLNWTTCNCADKTVPTTGDGFMEDGGSSNEKIILLDPDLNVLDAVSRSSTPSASVSITTASLAGACTSRTFDLDLMTINYESIGISTGIDNSFARRVDGDCGWVKTTDISADAPNKTGSTSSATYSFTTLSASECNGTTGSISISVSAPDVPSLFPMTYTLAFDKDSNSVFDSNDDYFYGVDSSSPSIDINNLAYGRYKITVGSVSGCNLQSFDFFIFNCYGVLLPYKIKYFQFNGAREGKYSFISAIDGSENLKKIILEGSDGSKFNAIDELDNFSQDAKSFFSFTIPQSDYTYYRLHLIDVNNIESYSREVILHRNVAANLLWPNPCRDQAYLKVTSDKTTSAMGILYTQYGSIAKKIKINFNKGLNIITINTEELHKGIYQLAIEEMQRGTTFRYQLIKL